MTNLANAKKAETKKYFDRLKKKTPKNLDVLMQGLHDEEFERMDCLTCANCCKTTSPIFTSKDINRIAKFLKLSEYDFTEKYLYRDGDGHMVLQSAPCKFLDESDNKCLIYDIRPKACREYPHTNRKKFIQLAGITQKNTHICPAVYNIVEKLKEKIAI